MRKITLTIAAVILLAGLAVALPRHKPMIAPEPRAIDTLTVYDGIWKIILISEAGHLPVLKVVLP